LKLLRTTLIAALTFVCVMHPKSANSAGMPNDLVQQSGKLSSPFSVVASTNPLASVLVVSAPHKTYFFEPGAIVTRTNKFLLVRGYGSLYIFDTARTSVAIRRLASTSFSSPASAPIEKNIALASALGRAVRPSAASQSCVDCAFPVAQGFVKDAPFGLEPTEPTLPIPNASERSQALKCAGSSCPTIGAVTPPGRIGGLPKEPLLSGPGRCFPDTYGLNSQVESCVPLTGSSSPASATFAPSLRGVKPDLTFGFATDYRWGLFNDNTDLDCNNPNPFFGEFDFFFVVAIDGYIPFTVVSIPPGPTFEFRFHGGIFGDSLTQMWFYDEPSFSYDGEATGLFARWVLNG